MELLIKAGGVHCIGFVPFHMLFRRIAVFLSGALLYGIPAASVF
jgi:hypothetical protein